MLRYWHSRRVRVEEKGGGSWDNNMMSDDQQTSIRLHVMALASFGSRAILLGDNILLKAETRLGALRSHILRIDVVYSGDTIHQS